MGTQNFRNFFKVMIFQDAERNLENESILMLKVFFSGGSYKCDMETF